MRRVRAMLFGACVLVAEDECIIAMDLADTFESAGATVIGPAATVREALRLLATKPVDRAFLDFNLADGEVTPVMEMLSSKGGADGHLHGSWLAPGACIPASLCDGAAQTRVSEA